MPRKVYGIENLDCAACAAKLEREIQKIPGVEEATIAFATEQLRITAEDPDALLPEIRRVAAEMEPDVTVSERKDRSGHHEHHEHHHHHEEGECGCGHEHHHHDDDEDECCGHEHHHHHDHDHGCCCGHDHENGEVRESRPLTGKGVTIYTVENLDCAACAAKLESRLRTVEGVEDLTITYATKQLRIRAKDPAALLPELRRVAVSMEPDVEILEEAARGKTAKREEGNEEKRDLACLCAGALLFILGVIFKNTGVMLGGLSASVPVFIAAYVLLGWEVVLTALRNLIKGRLFDENFLMSIATVGAFAIGSYSEAVGVMLFYQIGEFFEHKAVERSRSQIMDAVDLRPEVVNLADGEEIEVIPAEDAKVGDVLLVRPGDRIPLDGVVLSGESRIDTSPITGEPVPVHVDVGDSVTSGCVNTSGQLKIRVEKPLSESMVTRILDSVENAAASKPKIDRFITKFARVYTPIVVGLAAFVALVLPLIIPGWHYFVDPAYTGTVGVLHGTSGTASVYTALSFLVMSCPCALVLSVPLAFFSGIGAGSKRGILFKGGVSIEALSDVKAVVMDKTGTITKGNFVLQKVLPQADMEENTLLALCAACEQTSTHPIANSIVTAAKERGLALPEPEELEELAGYGIRGITGGHEVLCGNRKLMERFGIAVTGAEAAHSGAEVLAAVDGSFAGRLEISDTLKEGAREAISALKRQGIATAMLTGDTEASAKAVAKEAGIDEVHAKLLPQEKLEKLQDIRSRRGSVMFVGDGINDAPVLAGADVGAAMGSGADAAIEAADVIYMNSSVGAIPQSISIARRTRRISWQNVIFALAIKIIVMILGLCGFASMWMAVFADSGVAMLCVLNSIRALYARD